MVETSTTEAAVIDRRKRSAAPTSRAADRARLKELASNYGAKCRVNGVGNEVCNAWRALTDAIDNLVVDEC